MRRFKGSRSCEVKRETYCDLNFFNAGVDVKNCVITGTNDGFVLDDDDLKQRKSIEKFG